MKMHKCLQINSEFKILLHIISTLTTYKTIIHIRKILKLKILKILYLCDEKHFISY